MSRPRIVNDDHLDFLDQLRESGETNMFGAGEYLVDEYEISKKDAKIILKYWIESFKD